MLLGPFEPTAELGVSASCLGRGAVGRKRPVDELAPDELSLDTSSTIAPDWTRLTSGNWWLWASVRVGWPRTKFCFGR